MPYAQWLGRLAVSGALLGALALLIDPAAMLGRLSALSAVGVLLACLALVVTFALGTVRFAIAAKRAAKAGNPSVVEVLQLVPLSLFTILLAHGFSLASETVRVNYLKRRCGLNVRDGIFIALADRMFGVGTCAILAAAALVLFPGVALPLRLCGAGLVVLGLGLLFGVASGRIPIPAFVRRFGIVHERLNLFLGSAGDAVLQMLLTTLSCVPLGLAIYVLAQDMNAALSPLQCIIAAPIIYVGISVPFTFAGWGTREAAYVLLFGATGLLMAHQAVALSVALGGCIFASSLLGLLWLVVDRTSGSQPSGGLEEGDPTLNSSLQLQASVR